EHQDGHEPQRKLPRWSFAWPRKTHVGVTYDCKVLANVGHVLARNTIANILKRHGVEPAPERSRKITWKEFLNRHWDQIEASDCFTVEVWTCSGLKRFVRVVLHGSTAACGDWRNREQCKWIMGEPDCTKPNGHHRWLLHGKTLPHS